MARHLRVVLRTMAAGMTQLQIIVSILGAGLAFVYVQMLKADACGFRSVGLAHGAT